MRSHPSARLSLRFGALAALTIVTVVAPTAARAESAFCTRQLDKFDTLRVDFPADDTAIRAHREPMLQLGKVGDLVDRLATVVNNCNEGDRGGERWQKADAWVKESKATLAAWRKAYTDGTNAQSKVLQNINDFEVATRAVHVRLRTLFDVGQGKVGDDLAAYIKSWQDYEALVPLKTACDGKFKDLPADEPKKAEPHLKRGEACRIAGEWRAIHGGAVEKVHAAHGERLQARLAQAQDAIAKGEEIFDLAAPPFVTDAEFVAGQVALVDAAYKKAGKSAPPNPFELGEALGRFPAAVKAAVANTAWPKDARYSEPSIKSTLTDGGERQGLKLVRYAPVAAEWAIEKNALAIPLRRYRTVIARYQQKGEAFCRQYLLNVNSQYAGGGRYEGPTVDFQNRPFRVSGCK